MPVSTHTIALLIMAVSAPINGVLVVVRRLRPGRLCAASAGPTGCPPAPKGCNATGSPCAKLALLKVPRSGSTWLTKELRAFGVGVQLEFEPFTDPSARTCPGRFYTLALGKALGQRQRCVTRESRALSCYWGRLGCNATRLKPRPDHRSRKSVNFSLHAAPASANRAGTSTGSQQQLQQQQGETPGALITGFLINPMYAPGAIWNRVLAAQPRSRLVWLRRTNLVKMALSDLRRLAGAAARQQQHQHGASPEAAQAARHGEQSSFVEPRTLLTRLNMTLVSQATFPAAAGALDRGLLVLYEDLQTQRLTVLRGLFRFLGIDHLPHIVETLRTQQVDTARGAHVVAATHWQKASEDVCRGLPQGNCGRLREALEGKPCLLAQLKSTTASAWSFPNHEGTLSLAELDGDCHQLPPLPEVDDSTEHSSANIRGDAAGTSQPCHAHRTLFDLYGTRLHPLQRPAPAASGASAAPETDAAAPPAMAAQLTACDGRDRSAEIAQRYVLPYSLSRGADAGEASSPQATSSWQTSAAASLSADGTSPDAGASSAPNAAAGRHHQGHAKRAAAVAAPHMVRPWQRMVHASDLGANAVSSGAGQEGIPTPAGGRAKGATRFVIFSRQRSASTTFVGLLNLHPNVTSRWESFSNSFTASKMRSFLGMANRSEQLSHIPDFMRRFWGACPTRACGFKLLNAQVRPMDRVPQIFTVTTPDGAVRPSPVPVRRLVLERGDISAEFDSWKRAQSTGNWGTSPEAQKQFSTSGGRVNVTSGARAAQQAQAAAHLAFRGCRGCDPDSVARNQAFANAIGPARFAYQHRAWFRFAHEAVPIGRSPLLHIFSENLTSSLEACNQTMARVYAFLDLPSLPNNWCAHSWHTPPSR